MMQSEGTPMKSTTRSFTILEAMHDPALFGPWFARRASWRAWEVFLAALFGLPVGDEDAAAIYSRHTGRAGMPTTAAREAWVIVGRRGGKSRIAALVAVYLACFRDYAGVLAPGEVGTLAVIAADRRQARTVMRYITGFLDAIPMLKALVVNQTRESIELSNRVVIEVHTANFRSTRGYTLIGVVCDEIAFWRNDDGSANPDTEILNGLRPGMATVPEALLVAISSPYARRGALWEAYRRHYAKDGGVLVWKGDTQSMNASVDPAIIAEAYEADEAAAAAEYGAEFRRDIESFISREVVDAAVVPGRFELPPIAGQDYVGFVDPSGGSQDSMTLAIAHRETDGAVLDCVRERRAPFNPSEVVAEFVATLKLYGISRVIGDRYAGEWPRERFREHDITYQAAEKSKSEYYLDLLPLLNSGSVRLLEHSRLVAQLTSLERRTARGGRDSVDHPPGFHDDVVNAAAGALVEARRPYGWVVLSESDSVAASPTLNAYQQQIARVFPEVFEQPTELTCGQCINRIQKLRGTVMHSYCELRFFYIQDADIACDVFDLMP